jgi:hypothetical protein
MAVKGKIEVHERLPARKREHGGLSVVSAYGTDMRTMPIT